MFRRLGIAKKAILKVSNRSANSILQKYAPPIAYDERFLERAQLALTESDKEGKSPEEILELEREMAIYIKQVELQKKEHKRIRQDMGSVRVLSESHQEHWMPYYQRQIRDRLEWITSNQPKRPVIQEKSSSVYPYKFYGEMTEWQGLDRQLNICRRNAQIISSRNNQYTSSTGKMYFSRNNQLTRNVMLRKQFLSAEFLVNLAPKMTQPYLRLARYDKPIGYQLLFVPGALSLLAGCPYGQLPSLYILSIFGAGTLLTRGAGCTINDIFDHKLDAHVERCKSRPIPSGDVSVEKAAVFFAAQMTAAFGLLCLLNPTTFWLGFMAPIPIMLYPLAKRSSIPEKFKHSALSYAFKPQVALGLTFNWGAFMGYSAMTDEINLNIQVPLYLGCVAWTLLYDTVYALQDVRDDKKLGLNSMADFSNLLPKDYRHNPAKAFRSHRSRQIIRSHQAKAQGNFINKCIIFNTCAFGIWAMALQNHNIITDADTVTWGLLATMVAQYNWYNFGTQAGTGSTEKIKWEQFFKQQKWVGLFWICLLLACHGAWNQIRFYDEEGQRIFPVREEFKKITTVFV